MLEINVRYAKPGDWATFDYKGRHYEGALRNYVGPLSAVDFPVKPILEEFARTPLTILCYKGDDTFIAVVALRPGCNPVTGDVKNLHVYDEPPTDNEDEDEDDDEYPYLVDVPFDELEPGDSIAMRKGTTIVFDNIESIVSRGGKTVMRLEGFADRLFAVAREDSHDETSWKLISAKRSMDDEEDEDDSDCGAGHGDDAREQPLVQKIDLEDTRPGDRITLTLDDENWISMKAKTVCHDSDGSTYFGFKGFDNWFCVRPDDTADRKGWKFTGAHRLVTDTKPGKGKETRA